MSKKIYKTREEAEEVLNRDSQHKHEDWFCPEINGRCRKDCYCHVDGRVDIDKWGSTLQGFYVLNPYCKHYSLVGPIY